MPGVRWWGFRNMTAIVDGIIERLVELFSAEISKVYLVFEALAMETMTEAFWSHPLISQSLAIARTLGIILATGTIAVVVFDIAEEISSRSIIDWGRVVSNFIKGLSFAYLAPYVGQLIITTTYQLALIFRIRVAESSAIEQEGVFMYFLYVAGLYAFLFLSLMRLGSMFVLSLSSPFYVPDIVRGETKAIGEWGRQAVAVGFTYLFQYMLFYLGAFFLNNAGESAMNIVLGFALWLALTQVPKLLAKYGMSSGTAGIVSSAAHTVQSTASLFR